MSASEPVGAALPTWEEAIRPEADAGAASEARPRIRLQPPPGGTIRTQRLSPWSISSASVNPSFPT